MINKSKMASNLLIYTNVPPVENERLCPVCEEEAPPGEVHHPHYGGICCYGCRAFFRRAHQKTKTPKLTCRGSGNCEIAPKGQARCKKCRYEKCIKVGMDPKWVMTAEQKRIRFQHYYKKKMEKAAGRGETSTADETHIGERRLKTSATRRRKFPIQSDHASMNIPSLIPISRQARLRPTTECDFVPSPSSSRAVTTTNSKPNHVDADISHIPYGSNLLTTLPSASYNTQILANRSIFSLQTNHPQVSHNQTHSSFRNIVEKSSDAHSLGEQTFSNPTPRLQRILDIFTLVSSKLDSATELEPELLKCHQRKLVFSKLTLVSQLSKIASMVTEFAQTLPSFAALTTHDRLILLKANVPLYLQYILARYFHCNDSTQQISWILERPVDLSNEDFLHVINLQEYQYSSNLFSRADMENLYAYYSKNVNEFYDFPQSCNAFIANLLLFRSNESLAVELSEPSKVLKNFQESKLMFRYALDTFDSLQEFSQKSEKLSLFIYTLETMKSLFDNCQIESNEMVRSTLSPDSALSHYTATEDAWLEQRLQQFQSRYQSVETPESHINAVINLLRFGIPVNSDFVSTWMRMSRERARRVLKIHPQFLTLSDYDQVSLFDKNYRSAIALSTAFIDLSSGGKEQLKYVLGFFNNSDSEFEEMFRGTIDLRSLTKSQLHQDEINCGRLDNQSKKFYLEMIRSVSDLLANPKLFQLLLMVSLLDTEGLPNLKAFGAISKLRQVYLRLFQRKLFSCGYSFIEYAKFKKALQMVKVFASYMEAFLE